MRLSEATTESEVLDVLARRAWYEAHDRAECPADRIPTGDDLCAWFDPGTQDFYKVESADGNAQWVPFRSEANNTPRFRLLRYGGEKHKRQFGLETVEEVHADWLTLPAPRPPHPLAELVRAWQNPPTPVEANTRSDRALPARLGMVEPNDNRAGRLFAPAMHAANDGQLVLPGFGTHVTMPTPALPLALYDLGVGKVAEPRGRGAPLALRLWVEAVLSVRLSDRATGRPVVMTVTLRDLLARLYPGQRQPRPNEYWPRLMAAVEALESPQARIPWEDPKTGKGGLARVVLVSSIPRGAGALDDDVRIIVDLPPGAEDGPIVSPNLARWGVKSAAKYRALIGLAFRWWQPGVTRRPIGRGRRRHWYQSNNPKDYGAPLTDDEAIALCFPTSIRAERRKLAFEARHALKELVDAGEAREVRGRILPPKGKSAG